MIESAKMRTACSSLLGVLLLTATPLSLRAEAPPAIAHLAPEKVTEAVALYNEIKGTIWLYKWAKGVVPFGFGDDGHIKMAAAWAKYQWWVIGPRQVLWQAGPGGAYKVLDFSEDMTSFTTRGFGNQLKESGTPKGEKLKE